MTTREPVDVLVVAALPEEFEAAREAASAGDSSSPGVRRWEQRDLDGSSPYLWGEYRIGDAAFTVALARPTRMGGRTTGPFAATLVDRLRPASVAMCGVCAGNPASTALGDVVVGSPVYEWDEGKHSASGFEGDHRPYLMDVRWERAAQDFVPAGLAGHGEASEDEALLWFLEQLHRGQQPRTHPAQNQYFPSGTWQSRLAQLEVQGLIRREPTGNAVLTGEGSHYVQRRLYDDVEGPQRLPFRVLTAPMASGSAVIADPEVWDRLRAMGMRGIAAIEMEAATIATVAHDQKLPWIVVKGVMDHADTGKDDRYKRFAARASAQVLFALLERLVARTGTVPSVDEPTNNVRNTEPTSMSLSMELQNAVRSARDYLRIGGFSRKKLIEQLSSDAGEGYSLEAATYAVDSLYIEPGERMEPSIAESTTAEPMSAERQNAVRSAQSYLRMGGLSRKKLIEQLDVGEGYPLEAASYAVDSLNIDYDEQAVQAAKRYLGLAGFSRRRLLEQLQFDGFTDSQALYGVTHAHL